MKKKDIMKKVKMYQKHSFEKQLSPGCGVGGACEDKIIMLRKNNANLARALSDQKIQTNHWYTEAITLKGEVQELQERVLKVSNNNVNLENVFGQTEKQIKECYEAIEKDFNSALDRIVQAVEKLTKVKQLVGVIQSVSKSSFQGPSNMFTRTPGSRVDLSSSGSVSSPRQRAVPPMVSGHVLQPVMVPLPKLKIDWNYREQNHFLAGEDSLNMSSTREQPSPENNEVREEEETLDAEEDHQPHEDAAATHDNVLEFQSRNEFDNTNLQTRLGEVTSRRYSLRCKTNSPPEQQAEEKAHTSTPDNDPLEGPSWLLDKGSRFRFRGRRGKMKKQKCVKVAGDPAALDLSSDEDADESVDVSPKLRKVGFQGSTSRRKVASPASAAENSPSLSLDHSCLDLDSPTSMRARLEALEAVGGRKSRRILKRKHFVNLRISEAEGEEAKDEDSFLSLQEDKHIGRGTMTNSENLSPKSVTPGKLSTGLDSSTVRSKEVPCNTSSAFISESPEVLKEDNDVTCKIVTDMDITLPVSNPVSQENPTTSIEKNIDDLENDCKFTRSKKKFFKREIELLEDMPKILERTPFDLSMLNESVVNMPSFSSYKTTEKENLPPVSAENGYEGASLCDVSVVLEDVMKQPVHSKTPEEFLKTTQKESQSAKCRSLHNPRKLRSGTRTPDHAVNNSKEIRKSKSARKAIKKNDSVITDTPAESTLNLELERLGKSASDDDRDTQIESQESGGIKAHVLSPDRVRKQDLEKCYVLVHRTPVLETGTPRVEKNKAPRRNMQNYLSDLYQKQQSSENRKNPQGQEEEVDAASYASPDILSISCNSSLVNIQRNTDHIEKKEEYEENTQTGVGNGNLEDCILSEDPCDEKQIQQGEDIHQEQLDSEKLGVAVNLDNHNEFEGFENSEMLRNLKRVPVMLKTFTDNLLNESSVEYNYEVQNSSDSITNATENPSRDGSRSRRKATLRVSSFKEVGLNRKMRRGKNDTVIISDEVVKGRGRSRERARGRGGESSDRGKIVDCMK